MFSTNHFIWLGICAVLITSLSIISIKCKFSLKTAALIMAGISFVSEMSKIFSHMEYANGVDITDGMVLSPKALPFHLCSLMIFAYFYLPFAKEGKLKKFILSFVVPVGIVGASIAILIATSGTSFVKPEPYQCFVYHSGMVWFAIYLICTKQTSLGIKNWKTNIITLFALAFSMIWVNSILSEYDTNFFFVVRPPAENLPILNLNNGWYVYFLTILLLGFIGVTLVHLPFIIKEKKKLKA